MGLGGDFRSAVHVVQLGMSLDPDAGGDKPEAQAMPFDRRTFNAILRDYLEHNGDEAEDGGEDAEAA